MTDETTPGPTTRGAAGSSGNRWEPAADRPATDRPAADESAPLATTPRGSAPTTPPGARPTEANAVDAEGTSWRDRLRRRPWRGQQAKTGVAAGVAALIVGGVGGFALGHATAGDHHDGFDGQGFGQRFDGRGHHDGFQTPAQLPGQPGQPGQLGPQGQLPGQPDGSSAAAPGDQGYDS